MIRAFLVFAMLVLHMVQPLVAKPSCAQSKHADEASCCCSPAEPASAPVASSSCCSSETERDALDPREVDGPMQSCGCMVSPVAPVVPTPVEGIELQLVGQGSVWLETEALEREDRLPSQPSRFNSFVDPIGSGPPLRLLIQVFRL